MPLTWDISDVKDRDGLYNDEGSMDAKWSTMILMTMPIGISHLTDKTAPEFWARLNLLQKLESGLVLRYEDGKPVPEMYTEDDVRRMVGLSTNASSRTRAQFLKDQVGSDLDRDVRHMTSTLNLPR